MNTKINKVIKILMFSDFFLNSAWGFLSPVFAIFIIQNIAGNSLAKAAEIAGFAALFYWVTKAFLQVPIGRYLDRNHGEKDDFLFSFLGLLLASTVPIGFLFSTTAWHIYFFNIIQAIGMAMYIPSWYAIFTRHIDKGREAFEWGLDSSILSLGIGITGAVGGIMAAMFGFKIIFIMMSAINIFSALLLLPIKKYMLAKDDSIHKILPSRTI